MSEFEKIAEETSQRAARVRCDAATYREGLRTIIDTLRTDLDANKEMDPDA
jgi:hypothetical protein